MSLAALCDWTNYISNKQLGYSSTGLPLKMNEMYVKTGTFAFLLYLLSNTHF